MDVERSRAAVRANPNLRHGVCCSTLGTTWIQPHSFQIWTLISVPSFTELVETWPGEDTIASAEISLIALLCSGGFNEEEINCVERKTKNGDVTEQAEKVKYRWSVKPGEGERVGASTRPQGQLKCRAGCRNVCKSKGTGISLKMGTSDMKIVREPFLLVFWVMY